MARGKRYQPAQVVNLLRQIEIAVAKGKTTDQTCREANIIEQTYYPSDPIASLEIDDKGAQHTGILNRLPL